MDDIVDMSSTLITSTIVILNELYLLFSLGDDKYNGDQFLKIYWNEVTNKLIIVEMVYLFEKCYIEIKIYYGIPVEKREKAIIKRKGDLKKYVLN